MCGVPARAAISDVLLSLILNFEARFLATEVVADVYVFLLGVEV